MLVVERILPAARDRLATIPDSALLMDAARLLQGPSSNVVVVCDDSGRMEGVITRTDIVRRISLCAGASCTMPASTVMTQDVTFCRPGDRLHDVWSVIKQSGLKNVPVVDQDMKPVGVLNARDAVQALLEDVQQEEELLRDYVMCVGYR